MLLHLSEMKKICNWKLLRKSAPPNKVISPCPAQLWDVLASQNAHNKISVLYIWPDITNWDQIQHQIRHSDYAFIKCLFPLASASAYWFSGLFSAITFGLKSFDFWLNSSIYCNSDVFISILGMSSLKLSQLSVCPLCKTSQFHWYILYWKRLCITIYIKV